MIKDDTLVSVRNRDNGSVSYMLDNGRDYRLYEPGEVKKIPFSELKMLSYKYGGKVLLEDCLVIEDKEALDALNMTVEPEYFYTKEQIRDILFNGSIDAFADFLDFAPEGAIDIAKDLAVKEQVPDTRKRKMLSEKTGLNIDNAIKVNEIMDAEDESTEEATPKQRRVQLEENKSETKTRRTEAPAQKIVIKK